MSPSEPSSSASPLTRKTKAQLIEIAEMTGLMDKEKAKNLTVVQLKA